LAYLDPVRFPGGRPPFWSFVTGDYLKNEAVFGAGPLWFIEVLLIFSVLYVLWRLPARPRPSKSAVESHFPSNILIALFALLLGVAGFLVRLWLPMGWNFELLNLQFPFFVQYVALFVVGLIAYRRNWLLGLPDRTGRLWLGLAVLTVFLFWPLVLGGGAIDQGLDSFRGGRHWQALAYALWESFLCLAMCIGLVYAFRRYANHQGKLSRFLSRNAYAAYLVHEVVIIAFAYVVRDVMLYPLLKWALVGLVAVPLCFGLGALIRKIPYADRVL
jgi:hypothetical protein